MNPGWLAGGLAAAVILLAAVWLMWPARALAEAGAVTPPAVGAAAPAFALLDQDGVERKLADYRGRWLVLYFYPKDDTPGCTTEACEFRDDYHQIKALGAELMGVSLDDVSSHKAFAEKYHLPFPLLADTGHVVARAYGVFKSIGPLKFATRQSFIIGPDGRVARHYKRVRPKSHSDEILRDLRELGAPASGAKSGGL